MKDKIRITATVSIEYEPDPIAYPEGATIEEMAKIDLENYENEPYWFLEDKSAQWSFKYEIVKDGSDGAPASTNIHGHKDLSE